MGQCKERGVKRFLQFTLDQGRGKGGLHRSSIAVSDETLEIGPGRMKGNGRSAVSFPASLARVLCGLPGWAKQGVGEGDLKGRICILGEISEESCLKAPLSLILCHNCLNDSDGGILLHQQ